MAEDGYVSLQLVGQIIRQPFLYQGSPDRVIAASVGASLTVFEGELGPKCVALPFPLLTWRHLLGFCLLNRNLYVSCRASFFKK